MGKGIRYMILLIFRFLKQIFLNFIFTIKILLLITFTYFEIKSNKGSFGICYFISFFEQESQYFSIMVAPSTVNTASCVALLPQITQGFVFPLTSTNALSDENFLCNECK